jgi:ribosomal protein S21
MLAVTVINGNINGALKKFGKKVSRADLFHDLRRHEFHLTRRQRRRLKDHKAEVARTKMLSQGKG